MVQGLRIGLVSARLRTERVWTAQNLWRDVHIPLGSLSDCHARQERNLTNQSRSADAALRARAARVVPGGFYGQVSAALMPAGTPQFFARAKGARVWDADGRE